MSKRTDRPERPQRPDRPQRPQRADPATAEADEGPVRRALPPADRLADKYHRNENRTRAREPDYPNPLADVPRTGNAEADSAADHEAFQEHIDKKMRDEEIRRSLAIDTEYFVTLSFLTRAHKAYFLELTGWDAYGDKYLDGHFVAEKLGLSLESDGRRDDPLNDVPPFNTSEKVDGTLASLVDEPLPAKSC